MCSDVESLLQAGGWAGQGQHGPSETGMFCVSPAGSPEGHRNLTEVWLSPLALLHGHSAPPTWPGTGRWGLCENEGGPGALLSPKDKPLAG